jgi:hypothetical protein
MVFYLVAGGDLYFVAMDARSMRGEAKRICVLVVGVDEKPAVDALMSLLNCVLWDLRLGPCSKKLGIRKRVYGYCAVTCTAIAIV